VAKNVYLASPLFTEHERNQIMTHARYLRARGYIVYVPMEHQIEDAWNLTNDEWAKKVFEEDVAAIRNCDEVHCLYYGLYSDSGTAWECGFAYGIGKPVKLFDMANEEVSLMMVQSAENKDMYSHKAQT